MFQIILPGDKKEDFVTKDKTVSLDAQLAAVQAHIEDLEVGQVANRQISVYFRELRVSITECFTQFRRPKSILKISRNLRYAKIKAFYFLI